MASFYLRSRPTANWVTGHAYSLGDKVVSSSATQGLGMCFEVTTAGTSSGSEPAWTYTVGSTTTDSGGVVWTARGAAGIWLASKTYVVGDRVCKVSQTTYNSASSCVWKCTTGGVAGGTEPTWPTTIVSGTTTQTDGGVTWTAIACKTWDDANPFLAALLKDAANSTIKFSAGDKIYVSKTHAEINVPAGFTNVVYTFPTGTTALPSLCLCVDDTGQLSSPITLATSAQFKIGSASGGFNAIQMSGSVVYIYGCQFINDASSAGIMQIPITSSGTLTYDNCILNLSNASNGSGRIELGCNGAGPSISKITLNNTKINFANAAHIIRIQPGDISWRNTPSGLTGTASSQLFDLNNGVNAGILTVEGVDLSGLSSGSMFGATLGGVGSNRVQLKNCKFSASTTFSTATNQGAGSPTIDAINCGSGGTNYTLKSYRPCGTIDHELTKIMTGGATDGTTGISWKMSSNVSDGFPYSLDSFEIGTWNDNSGSSKTATVEILTDSATALNNDDIWIELRYLKNAGDPMAGFINNSKADVLSAGAAQTTSTATWTTTGISNVMKQKLQVSFTPGQKGPVTAVVKLAKASTTVYVNPVLSIV